MPRVLITGGTGFLGTSLDKHLRREGYHVTPAGSNRDLTKGHKAVDLIKCRTPYDVIIHAAGSVGGIGANQRNPGKFMYDNLAMGMNMIEATRVHAPRAKFIMLGTVCAYPKHTEVPFKEEDLWLGYPEETNAPYGIAKKTLMKMVETYHEQYGFNGVNLVPVNMYGPCFSYDTEVLTLKGIKNIRDVEEGEMIYTLNPKTRKVETSTIIAKQRNKTNEWINFNSKSVDLRVTPEHDMWTVSSCGNLIKKKAKWFKKQIGKTGGQSIFPKHTLPESNLDNYTISLHDYIDTDHLVYDDLTVRDYKHRGSKKFPICYDKRDMCEFLGWYISEGCITNQISISQDKKSNPENVEAIKSLLNRMGITFGYDGHRFYFTSRLLSSFIKKHIGTGSRNKNIPSFIFSNAYDKSCRLRMFNSLMSGDGDKNMSRYTTSSKDLSNDFTHLCFLLDKQITSSYDGSCYRLSLRKSQQHKSIKYKNLSSDKVCNEDTYCLTTDKNHIIYAGRGNKLAWVGQCDHFELQNSHVIPAIILKFHMAMANDNPNVTLWGTGQVSREFLYVEDCCEAILKAIVSHPGPEPINIGTGKEITIEELAVKIGHYMGFEGVINFDTDKPDGQPRRCLDISRAKERLGFEATTPLDLGLEKTINWFRENVNV